MLSHRTAPESNSSPSKTPCSCNEEISTAWKQISVMTRVPFSLIIAASTQVANISAQSRGCASCASADPDERVIETLVLLYTRLVDLLEAAILIYTGPKEYIPTKVGGPYPDLVGHRSDLSSVVQRREQPVLDVVCLPSVMALGEYTLDERQSRQLALDVVGQTLKNLGAVLQDMPRKGREGRGDLREGNEVVESVYWFVLRADSGHKRGLSIIRQIN